MKKNTLNFNRVAISKRNWGIPLKVAPVLVFLFYLLNAGVLSAQTGVAINVTGQPAKSSAALDLSTGNGGKYGFLPPKVALQASNIEAPITSPSNGLMVFDTVTANTGVAAPPYNVSPGLYYWNSTLARWIGLNNAPNTPYGNNTHYWDTNGNMTMSSVATSYVAMGPNITFTPVHSTVYLTFTATFYTPAGASANQSVQVELRQGNTTVLAEASTLCTIYDGDGSSVGNISMTLPITVTPGTKTTFKIYWQTTVGSGETGNPVECYGTSAGGGNNAAFFIND